MTVSLDTFQSEAARLSYIHFIADKLQITAAFHVCAVNIPGS